MDKAKAGDGRAAADDPGLSPQQLVTGEVEALVSFWPEIRDDPALAPQVALDVLATWAHLRRFSPESVEAGVVARLQFLVRHDTQRLLACVLGVPFPEDFAADVGSLNEAWDHALEPSEFEDIECQNRELFDQLDRHSLALYAARRLASPGDSGATVLATWSALAEAAEQFVVDHPDEFLPAASLAAHMLAAYRTDLDVYDEPLWNTTLKHRALEELLEERDFGGSLSPAAHFRRLDRKWMAATARHWLRQAGTMQPGTEEYSQDVREPLAVAEPGPDSPATLRIRPVPLETESAPVRNDSPLPLAPSSRRRPRAVELLVERDREISAPTLAASASTSQTLKEADLLQARWAVEGDDAVFVRLQRDPGPDQVRELRVAVVGKAAELKKYRLAVCRFDDGSKPREVCLDPDFASVPLSESELAALTKLALVDFEGNERVVHLG